jgi:hypothetical protein
LSDQDETENGFETEKETRTRADETELERTQREVEEPEAFPTERET